MAKLLFIRTCPSCGHEEIGDKFEVLGCTECKVCGAKLSPYKAYHEVPADTSDPDNSTMDADGASVHDDPEPESYEPVAQSYTYDPFSIGSNPFSDYAAQESSRQTIQPQLEDGGTVSAPCINAPYAADVTYELVLRGGPLKVELPRLDTEGIVGRSFAGATALATFATVSRRQFSYFYLPEGGLRITNLSRFGTYVNGRMLDRDQYTGAAQSATVMPPSTITMGGQDFDLVVSNG